MQKSAELPCGRFFLELKIRNGLISTDLLSQRTYLGTLFLMCIASKVHRYSVQAHGSERWRDGYKRNIAI